MRCAGRLVALNSNASARSRTPPLRRTRIDSSVIVVVSSPVDAHGQVRPFQEGRVTKGIVRLHATVLFGEDGRGSVPTGWVGTWRRPSYFCFRFRFHRMFVFVVGRREEKECRRPNRRGFGTRENKGNVLPCLSIADGFGFRLPDLSFSFSHPSIGTYPAPLTRSTPISRPGTDPHRSPGSCGTIRMPA